MKRSWLVPLAVCITSSITSCITPKPLIVTARPSVDPEQPKARGTPHAKVRFYDTFWHALEEDDLQAAWIIAESRDQRALTDAIEALLAGRTAEADSIVSPLLRSRERDVRRAARMTYSAILTSTGDWPRLAAYADSAEREQPDGASVETWAPAFRNVSTSVDFADSVSVIPLTRSVTGVAMVPVMINGVKRHFWLDTGSSMTILSSEVADAAQVKGIGRDTLELVSSIGRLSTQATVVRSIRIGGVTVASAPAMIVSDVALQVREANSGMPPTPIDGVIGFDIIRLLDLTIDDAHNAVIIRKPVPHSDDAKHPRNLAWFGLPVVTLLSEDGASVHMLLDTGAEETFGTPSMAQKSDAQWRTAERRSIQGFGGSRIEAGVVIPSVRLFLGRVPLTFRRIFLYDAQYPMIFKLDGTLGAEVGRGGIIRIDMTNGLLDVSSAAQSEIGLKNSR